MYKHIKSEYNNVAIKSAQEADILLVKFVMQILWNEIR